MISMALQRAILHVPLKDAIAELHDQGLKFQIVSTDGVDNPNADLINFVEERASITVDDGKVTSVSAG